eukprot:6548054-Alexandrium_andersonii.AAC.1
MSTLTQRGTQTPRCVRCRVAVLCTPVLLHWHCRCCCCRSNCCACRVACSCCACWCCRRGRECC